MKLHAITSTLAVALAATTFAAQPVSPPASTTASTSENDEAAELAKKLNNPIASLISVPFQANWNYGLGDGGGTLFVMNFQPVIPVSISENWNLIIRTILPVVDAKDIFGPGLGNASGLANTTQSFFFSPKAPGPGGIVWGLGPVGYYPTATNSLLGPDKWGVGPTFVALVQPGAWTIGILANQIWSIGGDHNDPDVNALFLEPFINYTTKTHTSFFLNTESTYDWMQHQWTVPITGGIQQVFKIGKQPMALQVAGTYYADAPEGGPDWGLRVQFTLLYPTAHEAPAAPHYAK